jgi:hypothetical protein
MRFGMPGRFHQEEVGVVNQLKNFSLVKESIDEPREYILHVIK